MQTFCTVIYIKINPKGEVHYENRKEIYDTCFSNCSWSRMCYCRCQCSRKSHKRSETTVDSEHSSIYEVVKELEKTQGFADLQAKYKDLADAFKQINDGTMKMEDFIKVLKSLSVDEADKADLEDAIAKLEGKMIVTFVNEFNVLKPEEAKPNDDGTYEVKLNVPSLTDTMEGIQLWVYSKDGTKKFVVIDPVNIDKEGKTLTVNLNDGDFFMVIADAK